jgi:hypothetical protein
MRRGVVHRASSIPHFQLLVSDRIRVVVEEAVVLL